MKSVLVAAMMVLFSFGISRAGENPKLLKEIKRKAFFDLSQIKPDKNKEEFVIVKFRILNQQIEVVDIDGTREELTEMMMKKLEEMVIRTDAMCDTTYQYKFNFAKE